MALNGGEAARKLHPPTLRQMCDEAPGWEKVENEYLRKKEVEYHSKKTAISAWEQFVVNCQRLKRNFFEVKSLHQLHYSNHSQMVDAQEGNY